MKTREVWTFLRETYSKFSSDNATLFGAALAYYTFFSLAPLLLIAIAVAGFVFGAEAARGEVVSQLRFLVGEEAAAAIQQMLRRAQESRAGGITASLVGLATLVFGATRVFTNLQTALNVMWGASTSPNKRGIRAKARRMARKRAVSFLMVLGVGFLLLVSLLLSTILSTVGSYVVELTSASSSMILYRLSELLGSFGIITLLLAVVYKVLPDARIAWRDVWLGAVSTAFLFTIGKFAIGWYVGNRSIASVFGAAGSLVAVLLWVYYSTLILLFGAEMTQVFARRYGSRAKRSDAVAGREEAGGEASAAARST